MFHPLLDVGSINVKSVLETIAQGPSLHSKQLKRHIVPDDFEWRALIKGINEYRKQVIDEDGCAEVVNELLIRIIDAPMKKIKVMEVSK